MTSGISPGLEWRYLCEGGFLTLVEVLSLLVEVEIVGPLGVAPFLVPVADQGFGFELAGVVRGLFDDEITVHA